jgi:uncharacterized protein YndB with AHSA1/START domain
MEKETYKNSIELNASLGRVWKIVTEPALIKEWASAFGHGTHADSEWKVGSTVEWKDMGGNIGAKGIISNMEPEKELRVDFFDDVKMTDPAELGEYSEIYSMKNDGDVTTLTITMGPLEHKYMKGFVPMWDRAFKLIKNLAEK